MAYGDALLRAHLRQLTWVNIVLDMQKARNRSSTYRTLVCLHPHDLRAVDAQTHVSARQHDRVFGGLVADNAFFLGLVVEVRSHIINSIDVIKIHNLIVVQKLLLDVFISEVVLAIF